MRILILLLVAAATGCAHVPSGPIPDLQQTYYRGRREVRLPSGRQVALFDVLVQRTLDRQSSTIVERVTDRDPRLRHAREFVVTLRVDGQRFTAREAANTFTGTGTLVGRPWAWHSWHSTSRLQDGSTVHADDELGRGGRLRTRKRIVRQDGVLLVRTEETLEPVSATEYERARRALVGPALQRRLSAPR